MERAVFGPPFSIGGRRRPTPAPLARYAPRLWTTTGAPAYLGAARRPFKGRVRPPRHPRDQALPMRLILLFLAATTLAGCGMRSAAQYNAAGTIDPDTFMLASTAPVSSDYRIGPADKLNLRVFQVADLSFDEIFVDASGKLQLPLLGSVQAAGLTPAELSADLERRLGERYLRNPRVSVSVSEAASQKITVDGAVAKPGIYEMRGRTTLLQAVAMAEGGTQIADLKKVAVFRTVEGRRMIAVFDLAAIRRGESPDPVVLGDDIIVVDTSRLNARYRDIIDILPALTVFAYL